MRPRAPQRLEFLHGAGECVVKIQGHESGRSSILGATRIGSTQSGRNKLQAFRRCSNVREDESTVLSSRLEPGCDATDSNSLIGTVTWSAGTPGAP